MLRDLRGWPTPAPILAAAAALDFGVVTYMIVRRLHPPPPGSRAPPQVTRRMAAAVLGRVARPWPSLFPSSGETLAASPALTATAAMKPPRRARLLAARLSTAPQTRNGWHP